MTASFGRSAFVSFSPVEPKNRWVVRGPLAFARFHQQNRRNPWQMALGNHGTSRTCGRFFVTEGRLVGDSERAAAREPSAFSSSLASRSLAAGTAKPRKQQVSRSRLFRHASRRTHLPWVPPTFASSARREPFAARGRIHTANSASVRSEERRVGKECRSRWSP